MASGELLRSLFSSYKAGDDAALRHVLERIIEEERSKNHRLLADELERIAFNGRSQVGLVRQYRDFPDLPKDRETGLPLVQIEEPRLDFGRLIAPPRTSIPLERVADEYHRRDLLATAGLSPTRTVLFYGPPGCGKSLAAQVMAGVLYRPLVTVRLDGLVSSFLGQTATNLRRIFDFLARGQWVVLFDEFDAIGKDRDNAFEHGELKRVVNSLLQLIDGYRGDSLFIAATNHERLLDDAIWRRFEAVIPFLRPRLQDRVLLLRLYLRGFDYSALDIEGIAKRLDGATGSDIEMVTVFAARRAILDGRSAIHRPDITVAIEALNERMSVERTDARVHRHSTAAANE